MIWKSRNLACLAGTLLFLSLLGICSSGNARRRDDYPPRIVEHPESVVVRKNAPTTLNCRAEGRPEPKITWLKDGEQITDDIHRTIAITGALYFLRVVSGKNRDDTGIYQCVAANDMGKAYSNNVTLEIAYLRSDFREEPVDTLAVVGMPIILECSPPRGHPVPVVSWEKDGEIVKPDGDRVRIMDDGNLMISEARQSDKGNYICVVENGYFDIKRSSPAIVNIKARPTFRVVPEDVISAPGDQVNLHCEVDGDPRPTITWSKQEGELPSGRYTQMSDNSLRIYHVTTEDEGIYTCRAENSWGVNTMEVLVTVTMEPTFTVVPVDKTVKLGETAVLNCRATGSPPPVILWQKDDLQLIFSSQVGRFSMTDDGSSLEIASVTEEDEGYFVCTAYSNVGSIKAKAFLTVTVPPNHEKQDSTGQPPPIIEYGPSNQTLATGTEAMFLCQATGTPEPTIEWTKDGNPVELSTQRYVSRFSILESGTLQIASLRQRDSGLYKCRARNDFGETQWGATLTVIENQDDSRIQQTPAKSEFPNTPGQPVASNISRNALRLTWDEPDRRRGITHYQVEFHNVDTDMGWHIVTRNVQDTSYFVRNLQAENTYLFLVRAVNNKAIGPPSQLSDPISTIDVDVTQPAPTIEQILANTRPRITSAQPLSQSAIKIVWEVAQNRDAVEGYFVKYKPRYSDHSFSSMEVVTGSTSNRILTGLEPAKEYLVIVQPFHGKIEGPDSEPVAVRTLSDGSELESEQGPPSKVLKEKLDSCGITISGIMAIGPYTLKVSWLVERHSEYIDGYHVRFRPGRNNEEFSVESVSTDGETNALLHSLAPYTEYTIEVQPFKDRFTGKFSEEVHMRTGEDAPKAPPVKVEAKSHNSTSIYISWLPAPSSSIPGILLGYHVYCLGNTSSQHQNRTADNTSLDLTVDGLIPDKMYRVKVAAFTSIGTGPPSKVLYVFLPPAEDMDAASLRMFDSFFEKKWVVVIIGIVLALLLIAVGIVVYRRYNKPKQASPTNKATISRDNATVQNMPCLGGQLNTNQSSNHQVWTDQTWPPHNCQETKCTHHGNNRGCMTTTCCNGKGSLTDTLDKSQFLYPNWAATGAPHMWQQYSAYDAEANKHPYQPNLQTQESKDTQDTQSSRFCGSNPTLSTFQGSMSRQGKVVLTKPSPCSTPEYAIVENDEYMSQHSNSLPLPKCPNHPEGAVITVMPQDPVPYASAALFLAPNMREYMAHRNKCQENSADSRCSSRHNGSRVDSGMYGDIDNAVYSGSGGSLPGHKPGVMDPPLSCLSEYATVGHSDSGNSTGTDERGNRRRYKMRGGPASKHPVRNWKELLPPPPEQPPTDIDSPPSSPDYPCPAITYSSHGTPNCCQSSTACPGNSCHDMYRQEPALSMPRDKAPLPPVRQHHSMSPQCNGEPTGLVVVANGHPNNSIIHGSKGVQEHLMPNNLSSHQKELHMEQTVPLLSNLPDRTGDSLIASRQVFEDPRHEQLGKELLEFNDDMSQSELCTDNEDGEEEDGEKEDERGCTHLSGGQDKQPNGIANGHRQPYLSDVNTNHKGDVDTDNETASICTDSMLATWDSVNGSTNSSARNSCASLSSEGSFFTNADFASAVAAAAEHAGMQVAATQAANQRPVKHPKPTASPQVKGRPHSNSDPTASPSTNKSPPPVAKKPTDNTLKGEATVNGSNSPVLQRVKSLPHTSYHSNGTDHHSNGSSRHSSPSNTGSRRGSLKHHHGKENGVSPSDKLLMRDTNDLGLTVTANPMAFAVEKTEALHV